MIFCQPMSPTTRLLSVPPDNFCRSERRRRPRRARARECRSGSACPPAGPRQSPGVEADRTNSATAMVRFAVTTSPVAGLASRGVGDLEFDTTHVAVQIEILARRLNRRIGIKSIPSARAASGGPPRSRTHRDPFNIEHERVGQVDRLQGGEASRVCRVMPGARSPSRARSRCVTGFGFGIRDL